MEETAQLVPPRNPWVRRPFGFVRAGFSLPPNGPPPFLPHRCSHYQREASVL
ncbi:MAG: hypothetical protein HYW48_05470 [Deltaproteobacteria bacterium]|nr:hypothetical protein [Deltaproteobacteria bacterium]